MGTPDHIGAGAPAQERQDGQSALLRVAHGVGHVVAEGASILLAPYSHGAEASTGIDATSAARRHRAEQYTAFSGPGDTAWGSEAPRR